MRIALLVTDLSPPRMGGISKVSTELLRQFCRKGHEVAVFCLPRTARSFEAPGGCELIPVELDWCLYREYPVVRFSLRAFRKLAQEHRRKPFDVSHAMNFNNYGYPFWRRSLRAEGLAHVATGFETTGMEIRAKWREWRSTPSLHCLGQIVMESYLAPWQRAYIGWADAITTEDVETRREFMAMGLDGKNIHLIPSGVDVESLLGEVVEERTLSELKALGSPLLLCPGRVDSRKGTQYLIRAFARFKAGQPRAHLMLAGGGRGDYVERMRRLAQEEGLGSSVTFTGVVKTLVPFYRACDGVVIPSLSEGIPITLQEALVFSKPVLCSRLAGTFDYARGCPAVLWAEPGDVESLSRGMEGFVGSVTAESLKQASEWIRGDDWSHVADRYLQVYEKARQKLT